MNSGREDFTDAELVSATLSGDRESFGTIVRRYQTPLFQLAKSRLGQTELAEEAVQEAFVSAYRSLHSYRTEFRFKTWLWTILLNECKRKYKRLKNRNMTSTELTDEITDLETEESGPLQLAINSERGEQVERLLTYLPDSQSTALRLRFFGGLKYQEIADTMGCSLSTAKMRVRVGLEKISAILISGDQNENGSLVGDSEA